jgi:hypothetical protein
MKKQFLIMLVAILGLSVATRAQGGGGFQRMSPEERVARIHSKLDSAFKLDAATFTALDTALVVLYRKQDAKMQELMAGGPGTIDRETMQAENSTLNEATTSARWRPGWSTSRWRRKQLISIILWL